MGRVNNMLLSLVIVISHVIIISVIHIMHIMDILLLLLLIIVIIRIIIHIIITPGLHNKIPGYNIFARGWVAQEPICS